MSNEKRLLFARWTQLDKELSELAEGNVSAETELATREQEVLEELRDIQADDELRQLAVRLRILTYLAFYFRSKRMSDKVREKVIQLTDGVYELCKENLSEDDQEMLIPFFRRECDSEIGFPLSAL